MKKILYACLAYLILSAACVKDHAMTTSVTDYPDSAYLKAEGIGQSETEARNQAVAEMSRIFESKVFSDTYDRVNLIIDSTGSETFRGRIESSIRLVSAVELKGARIVSTWFDKNQNVYHALAVLDRRQAGKNWQSEIEDMDSKIEGEFRLLDSVGSKYMKLASLMKIINHWVEREVLVSRLRILGFQESSAQSYNIKTAFYMIPRIKAGMLVFIEIAGEYGREIENKISGSLTMTGLVLSERQNNADVIITGTIETEPVELKNPGWKFARVRILMTITDALTGSTVGEISDNARAGHLTYTEAVHKAVQKISNTVSDKLVEYFK